MIKQICAGGVILNKDKVLVINQDNISWSLPKGQVEGNESLIECAKREIYEETGIKKLILVKELGCYQRNRIGKDGVSDDKSILKEIHIFVFKTNEDKIKPIDQRHPNGKWVAKNKVAELLTHPKDKEFFLSILEKL